MKMKHKISEKCRISKYDEHKENYADQNEDIKNLATSHTLAALKEALYGDDYIYGILSKNLRETFGADLIRQAIESYDKEEYRTAREEIKKDCLESSYQVAFQMNCFESNINEENLYEYMKTILELNSLEIIGDMFIKLMD